MRAKTKINLYAGLILTLLLIGLTSPFASKVGASPAAKIWTDQADYHPGTTVTIYGSGFAPFSQVSLEVTKVRDGTVTNWNILSKANGSFVTTYQIDKQGAPLYKVTATDGSASIKTSFTDSVNQPIIVTMANGAPSSTVVVTDTTTPVDSSTINADGTLQYVTMEGSDSFTLSFINSGDNRDGFSNSGFSETSIIYTASIVELDVTAFAQIQNTFTVTGLSETDAVALTSTYLGSGGSTIVTLNTDNGWSTTAWSDYNTAVTFPASSTQNGDTEGLVIGRSHHFRHHHRRLNHIAGLCSPVPGNF